MKGIVSKIVSIPWLLFIVSTILFFTTSVGIMNSGDGTQYALTKALVEKQTVQIDDFFYYTYNTDYAVFNDHYYSDREPGQSFMAVPFYAMGKLLNPITVLPYNGQHEGSTADAGVQVHTIMFVSLLAALAVVLVYKIAFHFTQKRLPSFLTAGTLAVGTLVWKYSSGFYRQPVTMCFLLLAFYCILKGRSASKLFLSGIFLGLTLACDLTMIFPVGAFVLYIVFTSIVKQLSHHKVLIVFFIGIVISLALNAGYNAVVFKSPFTNPHLYEGNPNWAFQKNAYSNFQSPIQYSLPAVLFSASPLSPKAIAPIFWNDDVLRDAQGASWATKRQFKGIFTQTPVLYLALFGFIYLLRKKEIIVCFLLGATFIVPMSMLTMYYSANTYDTRYFLQAVPFITIGLAGWYTWLFGLKRKLMKMFLIIISLDLTALSLYHGWYSVVTHYAPNLTGEIRFNPEDTVDMATLFINTFPNIYNLHIAVIYILLVYSTYKLYLFCRNQYVHRRISRKSAV